MTTKEQHRRYDNSEKGRARKRAHDKRKRERMKAQGICTNCRKYPADLGYVRCAECRHRDQERLWLAGS